MPMLASNSAMRRLTVDWLTLRSPAVWVRLPLLATPRKYLRSFQSTLVFHFCSIIPRLSSVFFHPRCMSTPEQNYVSRPE